MADKLLLGIADEAMKYNDDAVCGWSTNKFGGSPNWMHGTPEEFPSCLICGNLLSLVSQVYCPLHDSNYHRVLYLFACVNPGCWNQERSWKVLRSQTRDASGSSQQLNTTETFDHFGNEDWCDDAEDWGDADSTMVEMENFIGRMTLKEDSTGSGTKSDQEIHTELPGSTALPQSIVPGQHSTATCFAPYYVSVLEQPNQMVPASQMSLHERELLSEYEREEGTRLKDLVQSVGCNSNVSAGEVYEKTSLKHGDQAFYKFYKELQYYPQQCLRYMWHGKPLTISGKDATELKENVPNCPYCGGERVYELQLMPALVHLLKRSKSKQKSLQVSHNNQFEKERGHGVELDVGGKSLNMRTCSESKDEDTSHQGHSSLRIVSKQPSVTGSAACSTSAASESRSLVKNGESKGGLKISESQGFHIETSDSPSDSDTVAIIAEEPSLFPSKVLLSAVTSNTEDTVEFGTVIVYTCAKSCWTEGVGSAVYMEEFVVVEPDPDSLLFL